MPVLSDVIIIWHIKACRCKTTFSQYRLQASWIL